MADFSFDAGSDGIAPGSGSGSGEGSGGPGTGGAGVAPSSGGSPAGGFTDATAASATDGAIPIKRRRGRPALTPEQRAERDAAKSAGTNSSGANAGKSEGLDLGFKKNDRAKVLQSIAGMHMMAAILTKQPIMQLTEVEAKALCNSVCDVADYHKISLDGAGGPLALYLALATTAYGIYVPRIAMLKSLKQGEQVVGVAPATPGEAKAQATQGAGHMDFSGDIASTVQ